MRMLALMGVLAFVSAHVQHSVQPTIDTSGKFGKGMKTQAGQYGCDQCEKSFSNENLLKYHVDNNMELKVACDLCGLQSSSKGNLAMHKKIHIAETKHECDGCDKKFTNKQNLMRHEKEVHYGRNV